MGKKRAGVLLLISILAAFSLVMAGCSSGGGAKGLKDDDVIKAVTTTVEAAMFSQGSPWAYRTPEAKVL